MSKMSIPKIERKLARLHEKFCEVLAKNARAVAWRIPNAPWLVLAREIHDEMASWERKKELMKANLFMSDKKHCIHCLNETFFLAEKTSCKECSNNGIKEGEEWVYRDLKEGEERTQAEEDAECLLGSAHGEGCSIIVCADCGKLHEHVPLTYD
jgi:hypothetical protein